MWSRFYIFFGVKKLGNTGETDCVVVVVKSGSKYLDDSLTMTDSRLSLPLKGMVRVAFCNEKMKL